MIRRIPLIFGVIRHRDRRCLAFEFFACCLLPVACFTSCNSPYTSKPKGYARIELPAKTYKIFNEPGFPYSFEYPAYAEIVKDSTYFDSNPENDFWRNISFPQFNAKIFLSYKKVGGTAIYKVPIGNGQYRDSVGINYFDRMVNDAFKLTNKNEDIATEKIDSIFQNPQGVSGIMFKLGGDVATQRQFFMTDTTTNFLRGALYFNATPNADSLAPVTQFLQADIDHLIETFRWTSPPRSPSP